MPGAAASARLCLLTIAGAVAASCAARLPPRPGGSPAPAADAVAIFQQATSHCAGLRTLTVELALSGRAGEQSLRGRVITGLQRGGAARLEGVAPFGAPVFILVAKGEQATLLLPRDHRVLRSVSMADVLERLTGLPLGADDLLLSLSACVGVGEATAGRQWPGGWRAVAVPGERTVFLREIAGAWVVAAVDGGGWRADYTEVLNGFPRRVRLRASDGQVDLTAAIQQLEVNAGLDEAAFELEIPAAAEPMTLDELRSVAPLRTP
jgi:outer membrane lipoprotein-sorting protein